LYTITRVVSFEDRVRVKADPDSKLIGQWVDITNEANWEYLLDLGVEACELGFDEIQFDYIRFPAGITGAALRNRGTFTSEDRLAAVTGFLREAGNRIHPLGCAISADVFGIVLSSPTDEGIGQRPEEVSYVVDYISPMLYPSHYSPGTLGYEDPNSAPGPIISWALDKGLPRLEGGAVMRPWLQAFYYNGTQIGAEIFESEERGVGWMLWNAGGEYARSWLPDPE
ncbi:MAG: GTP-binding protein, partial [Acidimicrobiia bacterium]|nr:GTP-binding protein [Acidimicrobiia bacterium]